MNRDKAIAALVDHHNLIRDRAVFGTNQNTLASRQMWSRTRPILQALDKSLGMYTDPDDDSFEDRALNDIETALGILKYDREVAEILGPQGPSLDSASLHEVVWAAASRLWQQSKQDAVNVAARAVNHLLQDKLGDVERREVDLTNHAFSDSPPKPGETRLRFKENNKDTASSRLSGARGLGWACYSGIRNKNTHRHDVPLGDQEALEQLAAFSLLARWIDEAVVERNDDPPF